LTVLPVRLPTRAPRPAAEAVFFRWLGRLLVLCSLALNLLVLFVVLSFLWLVRGSALEERYHSGNRKADDKIAVVRIEGVIMEGLTGFYNRQLDQAAEDRNVKAVVLRINSPGGTITASDDLYHRICELRDGNPAKKTEAKSVVVSMGSMAASGGYYIAMPAQHLVAERTTITGSIGVYASFPNVSTLADKYGVRMNTVKAGEVKNSGSMFHPMTTAERQLWQDMVDHAFRQFQSVVEDGRPKLKGKLREVVIEKMIPERDEKGEIRGESVKEKGVKYVRRRADGGIFTADEAKQFGLIDQIGYLEDAIQEARREAGLGEQDYRAVEYERPLSLLGGLLGAKTPQPDGLRLDPDKLSSAMAPRLWYLAPQSEMAGYLAALGRGE
jgi:protease-4